MVCNPAHAKDKSTAAPCCCLCPLVFCDTQNQFDSIDLSDNAIVRLEGFSRLPRLKVLLLNNNRIAKIARNLEGRCLCVCLQHPCSLTKCTRQTPLAAAKGRHMSTAASEQQVRPRPDVCWHQRALLQLLLLPVVQLLSKTWRRSC